MGAPAPHGLGSLTPSVPEVRLERLGAASPDAATTARFVAQRAASPATAAVLPQTIDPARDAQVRQRLDDVRARFSGPYRVTGEEVKSAPMFRMGGGFNAAAAKSHEGELQKLCLAAGVKNAMRCVGGRSDAELLVRVTQVLIDNGKLPPGDAPASDRIKQMQWDWGIGVDCAGYVYEAARAVHGEARFPEANRPNAMVNTLGKMDKRPVEIARPGDIIHLENQKPTDHGHNVVVFSRTALDATGASALAAKLPTARGFLAESGPIVALEVDSSAGAAPTGDVSGGVRRDTWLFNVRTREWADFDPSTAELHRSMVGPQDERPTGAFHPKGVS